MENILFRNHATANNDKMGSKLDAIKQHIRNEFNEKGEFFMNENTQAPQRPFENIDFTDLRYPFIRRNLNVPAALEDFIQMMQIRQRSSDAEVNTIVKELCDVFAEAGYNVTEDLVDVLRTVIPKRYITHVTTHLGSILEVLGRPVIADAAVGFLDPTPEQLPESKETAQEPTAELPEMPAGQATAGRLIEQPTEDQPPTEETS